jgi:putative N-acetylmannosamine-6-phosphate epimerase
VLLADVDSLESALIAESLGCEAIATTLSGYTDIPAPPLPNIRLIEQIANKVSIPVIAEGGFSHPQSVKDAFSAGAWSVCIGTAITNPYLLTKNFLTAINQA